uniref:YghX family hydrolase n=1 Tax=Paracoccus sp. TRP TaxID=412597 RepID=UPI000225F84C|nr:YghX family hydrolase [Paracoccus sp. TRP]
MTERRKAADFHPRILEIFDGYVHGRITKRDFMVQAAQFATAGMSAVAIFEALRPNYALAQQVPPDDPAIRTETVSYDSPQGHGRISGLMARPAEAQGSLSAVLVVHENRGLNPYIADVVRRLGKAGYLAFGPDGLSSRGGYPGNDDQGREMQAGMDPARLMEDFFAAYEFLRDHADSTGKVGAVGFCYGGGVCNALAVAYADLAASVPFYGRQPRPEEVPQIRAPLLLHYAENDERVNAGWPDYEAALKKHGKEYQAHFYPGTQHGFHNDTTPRYDKQAAELAWQRTLEFFGEKLS